MDKIAVLLPCYNEEITIAKVVSDFREELPEAMIYVYNNNSKDRSVEIVESLQLNDPKLILRHEFRQGKGNVVKSMFRDIDAECYIMADADDTNPAKHAPEFAACILNHEADMVIGDRLSSTYFTENKRPFHNVGNVMVRNLINSLFKACVHDVFTGYRAFSREFVKGFPILSKGFEIETEMTIHAVDKNLLLKEILVDYRDRPEGSFSKLNTLSDGARVLKTLFMLFKNYKPMSFFGWVALALFLSAGLMMIPVLADFSRTGLVAKFPTLIVAGMVGLSSILSLSVGLILDVEIQKHKILYELIMNTYHLNQNQFKVTDSNEKADKN